MTFILRKNDPNFSIETLRWPFRELDRYPPGVLAPRPHVAANGEHDEPCVKVHRFMAECIRGSKHVVLRDVGHLTNLEAPGAFNATVSRFLRS